MALTMEIEKKFIPLEVLKGELQKIKNVGVNDLVEIEGKMYLAKNLKGIMATMKRIFSSEVYITDRTLTITYKTLNGSSGKIQCLPQRVQHGLFYCGPGLKYNKETKKHDEVENWKQYKKVYKVVIQ